jgi:hypothetical protein
LRDRSKDKNDDDTFDDSSDDSSDGSFDDSFMKLLLCERRGLTRVRPLGGSRVSL